MRAEKEVKVKSRRSDREGDSPANISPFSSAGAQQAVLADLQELAAKFPPTSREGRQLRADLATLRRKGLAAFLLETQDLLEYWRGQALTLQEITCVALLRLILKKAYMVLGVRGAQELVIVAGHGLDLGVCECCEGGLDCIQYCFGCSKRLCQSCNKSRSCYPLCSRCSSVWTAARIHALFRAFLALAREEQTEERFLDLRLRMAAAGEAIYPEGVNHEVSVKTSP